MPLKLYNTLGRKNEIFKPLKSKKAGIYACGPTVYNYAHLGNLRSYLTWDILRRLLKKNGYKTKYVMNITDVGHLTDDADEGEDKVEKMAAKEKKTAKEIAVFYEKAFMQNLSDLNIDKPDIICRATEHINEQIKMIKKLEQKGFTYSTADGIYFDTSKLSDYGKLAGLDKQKLRGGIRVSAGGKRHAADFALWKFSPKLQKRQMEWKSPWGIGFPGWHIECSAMSTKYLGIPFDIHCGGIDHIPVHHTNEIAQTEAATGKILAKFWLHNEFLNFGQEKMAKSTGTFITLNDLKEKNINPLAYRYFLLQTHYRKQLIFSWEALKAAENGLNHLYRSAKELSEKTKSSNEIYKKFLEIMDDDLNTPGALAFVWEKIKDKEIDKKTLWKIDAILGLEIKENAKKDKKEIPEEILKLVGEREKARKNKDWKRSDEIRVKIVALGYEVLDTAEGAKVERKQ